MLYHYFEVKIVYYEGSVIPRQWVTEFQQKQQLSSLRQTAMLSSSFLHTLVVQQDNMLNFHKLRFAKSLNTTNIPTFENDHE